MHLSGGNESELIQIFKTVQPDDWVLCSWRAHYHCLLKGVPQDALREAIRKGHSVSLCFPAQKVLCSGIVGGIAPIAVGLAWSLKRKNDAAFGPESFVWCFIGDMTARTGIVHECMEYGKGHGLPIRWVIEDNGHSVCTDTRDSWGRGKTAPWVHQYEYELARPHVGIGKWVAF